MPDPTLIIVDRSGRREHTPEAEPVLARLVDDRLELVLDDGETLVLPADAVRDVLGEAA